MFLKNLHSRFVRRLYLEHLPKGASTESDMDDNDAEEDNDEEGDIAGLRITTLLDHSAVQSQHYMLSCSCKPQCSAGTKIGCCSKSQ